MHRRRVFSADLASSDSPPEGRGRVLVGTQGWSYDQWEGVVYPPGTRPRDRLAHYARRFSFVECDSTFYRTPPAADPTLLGTAPPWTASPCPLS